MHNDAWLKRERKPRVYGVLQSVVGAGVTALLLALWQRLHSGGVDWTAISGLFVLSLVGVGFIVYLNRHELSDLRNRLAALEKLPPPTLITINGDRLDGKPARPVDIVSDSDPLIYPQFIDARTNGSDRRELQAYFALVNRGGLEARNVILDSIEMDGKVVQFTRHRIAAPLLPKREAYFYPDVVTIDNNSVTDRERDLFHLFCLDYIALGDSTICEATKALRATYQDSSLNLFEVTCESVFDPAAHNDVRMGHRGPNPAIVTRNHKFRKVAKAI